MPVCVTVCVSACACLYDSVSVFVGADTCWLPSPQTPPKGPGPPSACRYPHRSAGPVGTAHCWLSSQGAARGHGARVAGSVYFCSSVSRLPGVGGGGDLRGVTCRCFPARDAPSVRHNRHHPAAVHTWGVMGCPVSPSPPNTPINQHAWGHPLLSAGGFKRRPRSGLLTASPLGLPWACHPSGAGCHIFCGVPSLAIP